MKILCVDVGTGTQDALLYDSALDLENAYRLIVPSPTLMAGRRIHAATRRRSPLLITGRLMGGGPSQWAARDHVRAGLALYATSEAARTFDDDLDLVQKKMGVRVVSADEARALSEEVERVEFKDFDFPRLAQALAGFGVDTHKLDAVAVAVFDHGAAPPGYSDRQFRFDYLAEHCRAAQRLTAFAHRAEAIPAGLTRLQAVADSAREQGVTVPLVVMDTAPAAILGATFDPVVAREVAAGALVANVGNFHCLVFRLAAGGIEGFFEHHTGEVTADKLDRLTGALADGTLQHCDVFDDQGHGALVYNTTPMPAPRFLAVVGPRRSLLKESRFAPYMAVPYGDMMNAGNFGLLAALADLHPELAEPIGRSLGGQGGAAPWEESG
jgi:uncharacterized protein (DUF1786 family)